MELAERMASLATAGLSINSLAGGSLTATIAGASLVIALMGVATWAILTSRRMSGSSLFNRLFIVVATAAGFFSAVSSAFGFSLITSQESTDFFRNSILPAAFGAFVFVLAVAIWVGGAELVRHRDWFRAVRAGPLADALFFFERCVKLFIVIPVLAAILFFVSTWTTVVGIGGVDAVRHTYVFEVDRLQQECAGITAFRQKDFLFLEDLRLSVADVGRVARNERQSGARTGAPGRGAVTDYIDGVAEWLSGLEASVAGIIDAPDPSGVSPYDSAVCGATADRMKGQLGRNAYENYDAWARDFETSFEDFVIVLNRWRRDKRIETLLEQQLLNFERANPKPVGDAQGRLSAGQREAIDAYADQVTNALKSLIRKQKLAKPPEPQRSAGELSPERGLAILAQWFSSAPPKSDEPTAKSRTQAVVAAETIPRLSKLTPRDAVLKNASVFSDVWALAIAWDYASYVLLLAFLFFPSAERAAGYKDGAASTARTLSAQASKSGEKLTSRQSYPEFN